MHTTPVTLLDRLRHSPDEAAWRRLVHLYTPLLFSWARRAGMTEHDAADLVQEVLTVLVQILPQFHYDRQGHFRGWLRTITLNKLRDRKRREALVVNVPMDEDPAAADGADSFWEREYRHELTARALQLMQADFAPTTWKACWEFVAQGRSAADVASELGITENAVYLAKCRILRRLRQELAGLVE
ncbi:RNA polymerase sigma factor [Zavarzinella formosa]|uniref:RNA polymerase sigma factor n=1 Tax=Zavarzinella formosa TaxID=360055 RepID=UPI00035E84BD|nr:sigma-70 family RNA polymerase sigma factor [Zavarzinella formosa]